MAFTGKFAYMAHYFILPRLNPFNLGVDKDGWWFLVWLSAVRAKMFPGPGYLCIKDGVVWLWHLVANLYIQLTISSCYNSIPLTIVLIGRDGDLNSVSLCHSCIFWLLLVCVCVCICMYIYTYIHIHTHTHTHTHTQTQCVIKNIKNKNMVSSNS